MFQYEILIKSGTSGHYDYDNCDLLIKEDFNVSVTPNVGNKIKINNNTYIVTEIILNENLNKCYVIREYNGVEQLYIKKIDYLVDVISKDSSINNEKLKNFVSDWKNNK